MEEKFGFVFVYGTLLDDKNEFAVYLNNHCSFYAEGKFKGLLYDIGEYPGAILKYHGNNFVSGSIFKLNDPEEILKTLDNYEGFGENQPQPNEFIRELVAIKTDDKEMDCWVYLYNLPVINFTHIISGNYLVYKILRS
jgi:gamma-glutamylcyclotransferase (GGCT)/AIG2-like uncharacterized protein YtfP